MYLSIYTYIYIYTFIWWDGRWPGGTAQARSSRSCLKPGGTSAAAPLTAAYTPPSPTPMAYIKADFGLEPILYTLHPTP